MYVFILIDRQQTTYMKSVRCLLIRTELAFEVLLIQIATDVIKRHDIPLRNNMILCTAHYPYHGICSIHMNDNLTYTDVSLFMYPQISIFCPQRLKKGIR